MSDEAEKCGAESLRPIMGAYFRGSGEILAGADPVSYSGPRGHMCQLERGHEGPHQVQYIERVGYDVGVVYVYNWHDERELQCIPCVVKLEPDPMRIAPNSNSAGGGSVTVPLPAA